MTSHRLTDQDVTAIVEEKNSLVRENARLLSLIARLEHVIRGMEKAAELTAAGFQSACDSRDEMKQRIRHLGTQKEREQFGKEMEEEVEKLRNYIKTGVRE